MSIDADATDATVTALVLARFATIDADPPPPGSADAWSRLVMLTERRRHLEAMAANGDVDSRIWSVALEASDRALREVEAELLRDSDGDLRLTDVPYGDRVEIESFWERLDPSRRREYVRFLVEAVTVAPGRPGRAFDASRVGVAWAR